MNIAYALLRAGALAAALPPLSLMRALGRGLGRQAYRLDRRHRGIAEGNLRYAFKDRDDAWVRETARACFAHLGMVACEIPYLTRLSPERIASLVRFHGMERLVAVKEAGRGSALLTGHLGNWEWGNVAGAWRYWPPLVVARPLDWPPADRLVNAWRERTGSQVVPKANSGRRLYKHLRRGGSAGILLDQNVDWYDGVWVEFFGRPACTNKGLALLHHATGAAVLPFYCFRAPDGKFDLYVEPEIPLVDTGDKTQDVWDNTQNYTRALERIIVSRPEQWFWLHQRWKTKPYHRWPREGNK